MESIGKDEHTIAASTTTSTEKRERPKKQEKWQERR